MNRYFFATTLGIVLCLATLEPTPALAWPSEDVTSTSNIHKHMTNWAIDQLVSTHPELGTYRTQLNEGSVAELHEMPVNGDEWEAGEGDKWAVAMMLKKQAAAGTKYGLDLEAERIRHKGTNEGSNATGLWWEDARTAYAEGNKERAYFILGILMHFVQDMAVPAHANFIEHQGPGSWSAIIGFGGSFIEKSGLIHFDALEALAFRNWHRADFTALNKSDPGYSSPARYYEFSQDWARADKVWSKDDSLSFPIQWDDCDESQKDLLAYRLGRGSVTTKWALNAAANNW